MEIMKGKDLTLFLDEDGQESWLAACYGTSCEIDISRDLVQKGCAKTAKWKEYKPGKIGWTVSCGHLMNLAAEGTDYLGRLVSGEEVEVLVATTEEHAYEVLGASKSPDGRYWMRGTAIVKRVTTSGLNGSAATRSVELVGCGPLVDAYNTEV